MMDNDPSIFILFPCLSNQVHNSSESFKLAKLAFQKEGYY